MPRLIEGQDRHHVSLLPESLDDVIADDNAVRVVNAFVDELDLQALRFEGAQPVKTSRSSYHPAVQFKINIYGCLDRVQSNRRLERECRRHLELMWLTDSLSPDFRTVADFRRENGIGTRDLCLHFAERCGNSKYWCRPWSPSTAEVQGSRWVQAQLYAGQGAEVP